MGEFLIKITLFRVSRRENSGIVRCGTFFQVLFIEMHLFQETFPVLTNSYLRHYSEQLGN